MTNCQSWVVWINLRGHTIQRQATEDGNKSLVLFSMPFCIACPSTASCISVISVSGGTFYLASTWAESLSCRGCGCRCGGTMQSQYGLNTGERKWLEEGTRLSRFFFFYQQWVKIPIFSQRQYFQCAFELPMLFYCCWPTYNLPCQPPPKKKKKSAWARSSRQETPSEHSNRNSPPISLPTLPASHWSDAGQAL